MAKQIHLQVGIQTFSNILIYPGDIIIQLRDYLRSWTTIRGTIVITTLDIQFENLQENQTIEASIIQPNLPEDIIAHLHRQRMNPQYFVWTGTFAVPSTLPTIRI
jgi:hypothetical protein